MKLRALPRLFAIGALIACWAGPARATPPEDARAEECWRRLLADLGHARPDEAPVRVPFVGYTLRVPPSFLGGIPDPRRGADGAVVLFAWPPRLAPPTEEQRRVLTQPSSPYVRITVFGHEPFLHGQALLDAMSNLARFEDTRERDEAGFTVLRATSAMGLSNNWAEVRVSPDGPEHLFHCMIARPEPDGRKMPPNPLCTTQRWIGGPLRLEMTFQRVAIPQYRAMAASLERIFACALDPEETRSRAWPPR
ncbi:hypothetical protein [Sabulicella glaciei]|uniref:Uncharacterized protein n=1 Tax=Sabulicella glaciei TaxID=2984948 RepID=A0ABT3NYJ1_9PROT|nr:hypothetical protein [Roseococcus sp. MDT2-1-1]MCW8087185.1 hypothetical protein [Roseococcus sp. MDT2-1-1]